jgi:hypothetical protein
MLRFYFEIFIFLGASSSIRILELFFSCVFHMKQWQAEWHNTPLRLLLTAGSRANKTRTALRATSNDETFFTPLYLAICKPFKTDAVAFLRGTGAPDTLPRLPS